MYIPAGAGFPCQHLCGSNLGKVYPRRRGVARYTFRTSPLNFGISPLLRGLPWAILLGSAGRDHPAHSCIRIVGGPLFCGPLLLCPEISCWWVRRMKLIILCLASSRRSGLARS